MVKITPADLEIVFLKARTLSRWQKKDVPDTVLKDVYAAAAMGPTEGNCQPMRVVFVKSGPEKEKLKACLWNGNVEKTISAPVTAVIAADTRFYEKWPVLFPFADMRSLYEKTPDMMKTCLSRNTALQAAYLMIAARALGLDCGPMAGFDAKKINETFFPDGRYKVDFLCNLGYGDWDTLPPRAPRLTFEDACQIV